MVIDPEIDLAQVTGSEPQDSEGPGEHKDRYGARLQLARWEPDCHHCGRGVAAMNSDLLSLDFSISKSLNL